MAKNIYVGIDSKARKTKKMYVGIDGKARKAKKVYIGDANGKARLAWSADIVISAVPSQSGSLTYSGSAQSPSWSNYSSTSLTLGGTTSGTNATSYNATFTPKAGYVWSDGTYGAKTVSWSIGKANISTVPSQSGSLTYSGSAQSPSWSNYNTSQLTIGGTTSNTNAGTYSATFTPTSNYKWSDGSASKSANWTIGRKSVSKPTQSGSLTYSGSAQSPSWNSNYNTTYMTLGGTTSGTNAGSYNATFTATSNYSIEGSTSAVSVSWSIGRKSVTKPSQSGTLTYSGSSQSPSWSNYNTTYMTIGGTTSGTNAGSYNATFTPTANYSIGGTTTAVTVAWSIGRKSVSTPAQSGTLTYSGSAQSPKWNSNYNTTYMSLGGTTSGTNAGSYTATFTATSNYLIDGATSKNVSWSIGQANGYITLSATSATLTYPTTSGTFTVKSHHGGTLSVSRNTSSYATASLSGTTITYGWSAAGSTTITVTSGATTNYKSASATFTLTTAKGTSAITLSATSGTITKGKTGTFTVNNQLSRTLSVSSNNTGVATASVSGTTVTVTGVGVGSATITVSASATSYYNASSATYGATIKSASILLAFAGQTLFRSENNGTSWTELSSTPDAFISMVAFNNKFYGATSKGIIYSSTDGSSWTKVIDTGVYNSNMYTGKGFLKVLGNMLCWFAGTVIHFNASNYNMSYTTDGITWTKKQLCMDYDSSHYHMSYTSSVVALYDVIYGRTMLNTSQDYLIASFGSTSEQYLAYAVFPTYSPTLYPLAGGDGSSDDPYSTGYMYNNGSVIYGGGISGGYGWVNASLGIRNNNIYMSKKQNNTNSSLRPQIIVLEPYSSGSYKYKATSYIDSSGSTPSANSTVMNLVYNSGSDIRGLVGYGTTKFYSILNNTITYTGTHATSVIYPCTNSFMVTYKGEVGENNRIFGVSNFSSSSPKGVYYTDDYGKTVTLVSLANINTVSTNVGVCSKPST